MIFNGPRYGFRAGMGSVVGYEKLIFSAVGFSDSRQHSDGQRLTFIPNVPVDSSYRKWQHQQQQQQQQRQNFHRRPIDDVQDQQKDLDNACRPKWIRKQILKSMSLCALGHEHRNVTKVKTIKPCKYISDRLPKRKKEKKKINQKAPTKYKQPTEWYPQTEATSIHSTTVLHAKSQGIIICSRRISSQHESSVCRPGFLFSVPIRVCVCVCVFMWCLFGIEIFLFFGISCFFFHSLCPSLSPSFAPRVSQPPSIRLSFALLLCAH